MDGSPQHYWKCPEERDGQANFLAAAADEFPAPAEAEVSQLNRRDFLTAAGFAVAALSIAGCSRPPQRVALPMVTPEEGVVPGRARFYASTCSGCSAGCGLLVKSRDGRPIKLEGNPEHPLSRGGLCAVGQASLLGLYDRLRLQGPLANGQPSTWQDVDGDIRRQLDDIQRQGGKVRVLSGTILSPTCRDLIGRFLSRFPGGQHVVLDALSSSAVLDAHQSTHGVRALPHYRLERAEVIVSLDADFLGTWLSPVAFSRAYHEGRSLAGEAPRCSWHVQMEARLSLSGAKADQRLRILPGEIGLILSHLAARLAPRARFGWEAGQLPDSTIPTTTLDAIADRLWDKQGKSLVLCGSAKVEDQTLCNLLNHMLGNYGQAVDIQRPSMQRQGNDAAAAGLLRELQEGQVAALFILASNPVYSQAAGQEWAEALRRVPLLVSCAERPDETTALAKYVCPHPHFLASWGDAEPVAGILSLAQPTFPPLGNTRTVLESLATWSGNARSARQLVQDYWRDRVFPRQTTQRDFQAFWDKAVHDGVVDLPAPATPVRDFNLGAVRPALTVERPAENHFALALYPKVGLLDGSHAYNPWLHELPDPITKVVWDNYACLSPAAAQKLNIVDGDVVRIEADGVALELPALIQPGQHDQAVAIPLGYGSRLSERFGQVGPQWLEGQPTLGPNGLVGGNAAPFLGQKQVRLTKTGRQHPLATTQTHHSLSVPSRLAPAGEQRRPMIQETTLDAWPRWRAPRPHLGEDLWPADHLATPPRLRWGMVIDLNACTGCSACVIACQAENNVPVVGKDEVRRQREMHWIRIDRYYAEAGAQGDVDVAFQPMMCQHCGNAPCETVCPVLATVHSSEGLNQQVYNRCVGTRYCANNCPYKVRRFNWFNYPREDALHNLVLNPDVTVRSRGVMEKCSFCVQRIQEAKLEARRLGEPLADGAVQTACQQSCPAQAIYFGDLNDPNSAVSRLVRSGRGYQVLAELNVKPAVSYLPIVRNRVTPQPPPGERADRTGGDHG